VLAAIAGDPDLAPPRAVVIAGATAVPAGADREVVLDVDGRAITVRADPMTPLQRVLSDDLGVRAVRAPCGVGACGACAVLLDGRPVRSCLQATGLVGDRRIVTPAGIAEDDPVVRAFIDEGAAQCGSCIPGFVLATRALVEEAGHPDDEQIRAALGGHLCRCGTYARILDAALAAARRP
jgi:nicotinate dehydrogenase subunit A